MQAVKPEEARPFIWVCGQCGSRAIYRDEDRAEGDYCIACRICGNRYYPDAGLPGRTGELVVIRGDEAVQDSRQKKVGKAMRYPQTYPPRKVYVASPPPSPDGAGHFKSGRMDNIVTGPGRSGTGESGRCVMPQSRTRACRNCGRVLTILRDGCCWTCWRAGKGLVGKEKEAALAAIKEKIERGLIYCGGHRRKQTPAAPAAKDRAAAPEKPALKAPVPASAAKGGRAAGPGGKLPDVDPSAYPPGAVDLVELPAGPTIPVTIKLVIEIGVRIAGLGADRSAEAIKGVTC